MNTNEQYEKVLNALEHTKNLYNDFAGLFAAIWARKFSKLFNDELEVIYHQMYPRRKKVDLTVLPDEIVNPIRSKWQERVKRAYIHRLNQHDLLTNILLELLPNVDLTPKTSEEIHTLKRSYESDYRSQGYGAYKYAKQAVERYVPILERNGFYAHVQVRSYYGTDSKVFELVSNATPVQFDAVLRLDKTTVLEWAVQCWRNGTNPKVFDPFLDYEIFEKSCAIAMGKNS